MKRGPSKGYDVSPDSEVEQMEHFEALWIVSECCSTDGE